MAVATKRKAEVPANKAKSVRTLKIGIQAAKQPAAASPAPAATTATTAEASAIAEKMAPQLALIAGATTRTPFERRVWAALCQVPPGRTTTYGLLSAHLGSSPRAVGNALRRNPFAPGVPCHRVVATGGALGGFKGKIGPRDGEGITLVEKRSLLKSEGVRFDGAGRVLGTPWGGFV